MKIFTERVLCDVCGGPGVAMPKHAAGQWVGDRLRHTDPNTCAHYLAEQRRKLKAEKDEKKTD